MPAFDQFKDFLREMFQYDTNDLDFGIFKVLKLKRKYIEQFINGAGPDDLRATVIRELAKVENTDVEAAFLWLEPYCKDLGKRTREAWQALKESPLDAERKVKLEVAIDALDENADKAEAAKERVSLWVAGQHTSPANIEERLYNYLLNFFEMYYQNGDFGYNSRAANAFKVPYEADYDGSDTFFHWKHKDSYYIKTGSSFPSVKCEVAGKKLEFRLENGAESEAETTAQNNNKDKEIKLYRLDRIVEMDGAWQIVFHLAKTGTPKTELYPLLWSRIFDPEADLTRYLFKKEGTGDPSKPIFNDLSGDFDRTDSGQVKGVNQLRLKEESFYKELAKRTEFAGLGKSEAERAAALQGDPTAAALFQLDKALNQFFVGNDADYFIHKDLRAFLTKEKDRFIKNVIFSDLETLLNRSIDNTTLVICRGFNAVATRIIEFLDTIETFQRNIFTLKKKVVDTHWLISVGKIPARFHADIAANTEQVRQFKDLFHVEIKRVEQLIEHPTLIIDTSLFEPEWEHVLLSDSAFDNLDSITDGLLVESENWQALNLLSEKYSRKVKCVYLDPPYNTGNDGFLYKDSFRHSSWTSMFSDRLDLIKKFHSDNGVLLASIDDNEYINCHHSLKAVYGDEQILSPFIWKRKAGGGDDSGHTATEHEYVAVAIKADHSTCFSRIEHESAAMTAKYNKQENGRRYYLERLDKTSLTYSASMDYPITAPDGTEIFPPQPDPLNHTTIWRWGKTTVQDRLDEITFLKEDKTGEWRIYTRTWEPDERGVTPRSLLVNKEHGRNRDGTEELSNILGPKKFKNPKPSKFIKHLITIATSAKTDEDIVLDAFAGSGTTGHAVLALNKDKKSLKRKFLLIDMGAYFQEILKPRIQKVMYSLNWRDGKPIASQVDGYQGIVKVQRLEQYEDLLANLETAWDGKTLPKGLPVQYLFRPEHNKLVASLDISRPFSQTMKVGKAREERTIDLMETWLYLQGYGVKSRRKYIEGGKTYLAVETTGGILVIFRDTDTGEDDSAALDAIIARYQGHGGEPTVTRVELNHGADTRKVKLPVTLIHAADFDRGASWN